MNQELNITIYRRKEKQSRAESKIASSGGVHRWAHKVKTAFSFACVL